LIQVTPFHSLSHASLVSGLLYLQRTRNCASELCTYFAARLHLTRPITHPTLLTHNNSTIIHIHSGASPALHTHIKALLFGVIIVLDGMILHTTHGTKFLQHITITMAIPNITPATTVRGTQVTISRGTRLTSLTLPPYRDIKRLPPPYGDLKPPTQGQAPMLFTSCGTSPHDLQVSPYSINIPGPLVIVLVCPCSDLGE